MTDWHEHTGGPQPVADDVWVEAYDVFFDAEYADDAAGADWKYVRRWRILNEDLIKAARLEGIRLGLEAAKRHADACVAVQSGRLVSIPSLDPATIAREATLDTLTAEAQAQDMGYDKHDTKRLPAALIGQEPTNENK